ncbi:MAG: hypothetical protein AAB288_00415 [Acidobacteriota bacterium]
MLDAQKIDIIVPISALLVMMISYCTDRSKFVTPIEEAIENNRSDLTLSHEIVVPVEADAPGYSGQIVVVLSRHDPAKFESEKEFLQPSRFPARIKAAATALRNCGYFGKFEISHADGLVRIRNAQRF